MDNKKLVGIDEVQQGLSKFLSPEMLAMVMQNVNATNDEVVNQDLLRRSAPPAPQANKLQQSNIAEAGVVQTEIGIEVIEKLTDTFVNSEVMQTVLTRLMNLEETFEKQQLKYENQILRLNEELAQLKRTDEEKYTSRLNNIPATRKVVLTLANNGGVSRAYQPDEVQGADASQLDFDQRVQASLSRTKAFMAKNSRGGK